MTIHNSLQYPNSSSSEIIKITVQIFCKIVLLYNRICCAKHSNNICWKQQILNFNANVLEHKSEMN